MSIATVTSKGQITVPVAVRNDMGLEAGSKVEFVKCDDGSYILLPVTRSLADLKGMFTWDGPTITIEQMNEAIASAAAESGSA